MMVGHWPKAWAERGDMHSHVSNSLKKIREELFYRFGLPLNIQLEQVEYQPDEGEYVGRHVHTESYPSGGSADYAKFAYFDGKEWHQDKEWRFSGPGYDYNNKNIEWYTITRPRKFGDPTKSEADE